MFKYKVNLGIEGYTLESHVVEARNQVEARDIAISKYLHPDKGYTSVEVKRIKKNT